jgi:hypothetical protein
MHDHYFVFKGEKPEGMPFIVMTATFVSGASAWAPAASNPASSGGR